MFMTPYDEVIDGITKIGYHNHRREGHSDLVSDGLFYDLIAACPALRADVESGVVQHWINVRSPGGRKRLLDLFVGEPDPVTGEPDLKGLRIGVEHKSVITAHRNKTNRYDDLQRTLQAIWAERPQAVIAATVLVGTATRVLNIPDYVKKMHKADFGSVIQPRLSSGDEDLWVDFRAAISKNTEVDARKTVNLFRQLPTRSAGATHVCGFDYIQQVPVFIDNVNPPRLVRENELGLDIEKDYAKMLHSMAAAYTARFHM